MADTASITPIKPASGIRPWGVLLLAIVLGVGLLAVSVPRVAASLLRLPGEAVREGLTANSTPDTDAMRQAMTFLEEANGWMETAATHLLEGDLASFMALREKGEAAQVSWEKARTGYRASLILYPGQSRAWYKLAVAEWMLGGYTRAMAEALRLAIATELFNPQVMAQRLQLGFFAWASLDAGQRQAVGNQFLAVWSNAPQLAVDTVHKTMSGEIAMSLLADRPEEAKNFEARLQALAKNLPAPP